MIEGPKDLTEFVVKNRATKEDVQRIIEEAEPYVAEDETTVAGGDTQEQPPVKENPFEKMQKAIEAQIKADGAPRKAESFDTKTAAPLDFDPVTPKVPYGMSARGVFIARTVKQITTCEYILRHALYVGGRREDIDTGVESVTLVWDRDREWKARTVPQHVVASSRDIIALADASVLVNSNNARELVSYIAHLQSTRDIPRTGAVSSCGLKFVGGTRVFMWGANPIVSDASKPAPPIIFTDENHDLILPLRPGGTCDGWVTMARRLEAYPSVAFGVAASFLSPFLEPLGVEQNPIFDYAGLSTTGKTTAIKLAASVWGHAPEKENGLIKTWNSTPVFMERLGSVFNGLPLFLDESHTAKPDSVQQSLYQLANGSGKGRGAKLGGTQPTVHYRSVVFSAGEEKLTDASAHDGAGARIVTFWGSPFGEKQRDSVTDLSKALTTHYGQAGPFVLRAFFSQEPQMLALMRRTQASSQTRLLARVSEEDAIGGRLVPLFAAVEAVGTMANQVLGLGWDMSAITDAAFEKCAVSRPLSSAQTALNLIVSWADGNSHLFIGSAPDHDFLQGPEPPPLFPSSHPLEIAGLMRSDGAVAFHPDRLRRLLIERKFGNDSTVSKWADAGWLERDEKGKQNAKVMKVQGKSVRMVVLSPSAVSLARGQVGARGA